MVQLYQFQGQEYQFPDGVTEDEVLQFLQSQQPGPLNHHLLKNSPHQTQLKQEHCYQIQQMLILLAL
jgi:hypothetical protein